MCDVRHTSPVEQVRDVLGTLCSHEPNSPDLLWALLTHCAPDVVLDTRFAIADGREYHGRKGVREFFEEWLSSWRQWGWGVRDLFDTPNGVFVYATERAVSRGWVPVKQDHIQQWQMEGGKLKRWTIFASDFRPEFTVTKTEVAA